jgi:hypothetical protein
MSIGILTLGRICTGSGGAIDRDKIEVSSPFYRSMVLSSLLDYGDIGTNRMFLRSNLSPWGLYGQVLYLYSYLDIVDVSS